MFYREHSRYTFNSGDEQITKQSHKAECDINTILKQYQRTGIITHVQSARPQYTDLPDVLDYQSSLNLLLEADEAFASLPAKVRDHFNNSPAGFLAAFADPSQADTLRQFGLLKPVEAALGLPGASPTSPVNTSPTAPPAGPP
ncbi:MAG: internal scaffolding protein [Microvirus sp.]|nr:MAG: internal scaffolding protein [Microvirus sp.]